ncbi:hypothetical protein [Pseudoxanthomonas putridarboris]|uniref:Uncharacterized protein n=1 Tax=Pseudoxanthomonas putridarboris TaxID=752605 RepID=A0ABU9J557_9GAMM
MSVPNPSFPNKAEPVTLAQLREALAFMTEQYDKARDATSNVFVWLWEALQGDFNENRTTGQVVFDTAISMIPGVDQVCDVRDIIANCKQINEDKSNTWAWVALGLTLIGLFPSLGSLVKGVLKIFFLFVRRAGGNHVVKAVDEAMTWVITYLRRRDVQKYWKGLKWDHVFGELSKLVKSIRAEVNLSRLLKAFDRGISLMKSLLGKVEGIPYIGARAKEVIDLVVGIRRSADKYLKDALEPLQNALDAIIKRLEWEDLVQRRAIVNVRNVHYRGTLPEMRAITLMREAKPPPKWLSKGSPKYPPLKPNNKDVQRTLATGKAKGCLELKPKEIASFAQGMRAEVLQGPMRLYRVVSPGNMAASKDWMSEEVFNRLMKDADPKAAWRRHLAVWPDWNPNGQFVVYELKAGETLPVWRGPASSQVKDPGRGLDDYFLEGGWEQIKFDAGQLRKADGKAYGNAMDDMPFVKMDRRTGTPLSEEISYAEYEALPKSEKPKYEPMRKKIRQPRISGPFDTGWGMTDFDAQLTDVKLGLPALPGQTTRIQK